jgi:hypothetical protein
VLVAQLRTDFARRTRRRVDVHVGRSRSNCPNEVVEVAVADALSCPSCYADDVRGLDRAANRPTPAGQACTGTGELPRFVQRNTTTGPLFVLFSKWM